MNLGGLWGFLALGSLAPPSALASSGGLGLIASALGRWLASVLGLGWVAGSGFLGGWVWVSGWLALALALALLARSQR